MTIGEQILGKRHLAAGVLIGLAVGGMIALAIAMKPGLFAELLV